MLGCFGCKFRRGVGRVSQMSVGILLYTRVVGEFIMVGADYAGIIFNTRVARVRGVGVGRGGGIGRVAVCGMCWSIVCNPEWSERSRG